VRGDATGDGIVDPADGLAISDYLFFAVPLPCLDAADANDDGLISVPDTVLAAGGGPFPLPGDLIAGPDYTDGPFDCQIYTQATVFLRGDADADCDVDLADEAVISAFLFLGGPPPDCFAGADANADGILNFSDSVYLLAFLGGGGPPPPPPYPVCGLDPTNAFPCESPCAFIRGDADGDGQVDDDDATTISDYLFLGAPPPSCMDAADANDDGLVDGMDIVTVLASLVLGGGPLPAPSPHVCGIDPTPDALGCGDYVCTVPNDFRRGDCNADGLFDIADAVFALGVRFGGLAAPCLDACDAGDDGFVDIGDPIFLLAFQFTGGPPPLAPYPDCGYDPTPVDAVGCEDYGGVDCP
jgi:hypothetical protein